MNPAALKIYNVLGRDRGQRLLDELLRELGVPDATTPNDRVRLGNLLIQRGGVLESIGRAIKIQAILHGATID